MKNPQPDNQPAHEGPPDLLDALSTAPSLEAAGVVQPIARPFGIQESGEAWVLDGTTGEWVATSLSPCVEGYDDDEQQEAGR